MRRVGAWARGLVQVGGRWAVRSAALLVLVLLACYAPTRLRAQASIHAQAIPLVTRVVHAPGDRTLTEFALVQPAVMVEWSSRNTQHATRLSFHATLDGEGATIADGELAPGDYGEGFYDRRHPHTYVHELIATAQDLLGRQDGALELSVAAGKGFVAFGDDDPMSRPVVRYPVDHHFAQILERAVVIGSVRYGPARLEATWFNGDEPLRPTSWPNWRRGLDSRAIRLTVTPRPGLEAQYSHAKVLSPEHRDGAGTPQVKDDASVRWTGGLRGHDAYALVNWARTDEAGGFFVFHALTAEGALALGRNHAYFRFERTERPEDQRTADPFRSVRPPLDNASLGRTRWTNWTLGDGVSFLTARGRLELRPFVEGTLSHVVKVDGIFDPNGWYGGDVLPSLTLGVRLDWGGMSRMRMGHYFDQESTMAMPGMGM